MPDKDENPTAAEIEVQPTESDTPDVAAEIEKWKALSRKHEETAKRNKEAAEEAAALKAKLAEYEDANKTEAEKLLARAEAAEKRVAEAEAAQKAALLEAMKTRIGVEKRLPVELIKRLQGDDEETILADAEALLAALPKSEPTVDIGQGKKDTEAPPEDPFLAGMKQGMGRLIERK